MKIAVLGGAGFIGMHLLGAFLGRHSKRVFDKRAPEYDMKRHGSWGLDLSDAEDWEPVSNWRPDVIVNLIARLADRDTAIVVLRMADALMAGLTEGWCPHVVHLSSAAVYGEMDEGQILWLESSCGLGMNPFMEWVSLYGVDKIVGEIYMTRLAVAGIPTTIIRPANVYGPGQGGNVVDLFARRLKAGEPPIINTSAAVTRDFVHVDDVVAAIVAAIEQPPTYGQLRVYNVGTGIETTLGSLADMMREHLGGPRFLVDIQRPCGIRRSALDCSRIGEELGWEPKVALAEGLERTLREEGFLE